MTLRTVAPLLRWNVGSEVNSVTLSPDGSRVASGSNDSRVRIWDVQTGALVLDLLEGRSDWVWSVAWSHDGTFIASSSNDKTICIWDARASALAGKPLQGHNDKVHSVAFSPDDTRIVSGSADETIRIWDVHAGASIGEPLRGHTHFVWSVKFSADNTRIVSGSEDKTIRMWDAQTGAPIGEPLQGHIEGVLSVAFSPDSAYIVSGSYDKTIRIWNAYTGAPIGGPLRGHTHWVHSVVFSPDSTRIVSGSEDKTIRMWDVRTGAPIGELFQGHTGSVWSVAFSPDSTRIVSGSQDGSVCVWKAPPSMPSFDMVTSKMSAQEMFDCLVKHGCTDLTSSIDTNKTPSAVVAFGGFGEVRRTVMGNGTTAAVKTLRLHVLPKNDSKAVKRAVREVYIWSRLRHVNVQELLGIIVFQGGLGMVSPWRKNGNLQQYIVSDPRVERYPLCVQLASGVSYLHGVDMVHGDLKATNVLVSEDGVLKINDFDYAILSSGGLRFSTTTRPGGGTTRWMAPELFQPAAEDVYEDDNEGHEEEDDNEKETQHKATRSTQTDIYALGMTMLETLTGAVPYSEYRTDAGIYRAIERKEHPRRPKVLSGLDDRSVSMWELLLRCWDRNPSVRPDAPSVLARLASFASSGF